MTTIINIELCWRVLLVFGHFLWQGAALALAGTAAVWIFGRTSARVRYECWVAALFLMTLCPIGTFLVLSMPSEKPQAWAATYGSGTPSGLGAQNALTPFTGFTAPIAPTMLPGPVSHPGLDWKRFSPHIMTAYLLGVALMFGRVLLAMNGATRLRRWSEPVTDPGLLEMVARRSRAMRLRFIPAVAFCKEAVVPTVVGLARPMILLPVAFASGLPAAQVEAILVHELEHIRRYDYLVNLLQRLTEALLFFHPAVWLVSRRIRIEREHCCDDAVLAAGCEPLTYAESLVTQAERALGARAGRCAAAAALYADGGDLRGRVARLLRVPTTGEARVSAWPLTLVVLITGSLLAVWAAAKPVEEPTATGSGETALSGMRDTNNPASSSTFSLAGEWRSPKGMALTIKDSGDFTIEKYDQGRKESLFKGEIKIRFDSNAKRNPPEENDSLITTFVAEITVDKERSVVPGCFYSGEGDPSQVKFYQLDNGFGRKLGKYFNLRSYDILSLNSPGPGGEWKSSAFPREIPAKLNSGFKPDAGIEYTLPAPWLFSPGSGDHPGPAERDTSMAWSLANEFVYRTALAKDFIIPATQAGPADSGWHQVSFDGKDGKSRLVVEVQVASRIGRLPLAKEQPEGGAPAGEIKSCESPDGKFTAVISGTYESKVTIKTKDGRVICSKSYASPDGSHGFVVQRQEWTPDSRFFVCSLSSSGGHQPWHTLVDFCSVQNASIQSLDDYVGPITDPGFKIQAPDFVKGRSMRTNIGDQMDFDVSLSQLKPGDSTEYLKREIKRIEALCTPASGTTRQEVEKQFGAGKAAISAKVTQPKPVPEDSPYRAYQFGTNATLAVDYDKEWKVRSAHYGDPYSIKGRAYGVRIPRAEEMQELTRRLRQMEGILAEYQARFENGSLSASLPEQLAPGTKPLKEELVGVLFQRIYKQEKIEFELLCQALVGSQLTLRAEAATLLGDSGDKRAIPFLIDALSDESLHVGASYADDGDATTRHRANKALKKLTGQDFGFVWSDPKEKRNEAILKWIAWYRKITRAASSQ